MFKAILLTFLVSTAPLLSLARISPTLQTRVDAVLKKSLSDKKIVGAVVLVAKDGKIIYHHAVGLADREQSKKMSEDAIFRLASMTKPLVSAAALALVDEGKINLDDPITKWIPSFKPKLPDGTAPVITIRHLLTHTSGLNYGFFEAPTGPYHQLKVSDGLDLVNFDLEENVRRISQAPLLFPPGTKWQYSLAIDVLGLVLEKATSKSLPAIVAEKITTPLRMKDTEFLASHPERLATPYADGTPQPIRMQNPEAVPFGASAIIYSPERALSKTAYPSGGAGMVGTASDYLHFLEAVRHGGGKILKPSSGKGLTTSAVTIPVLRDGVSWTLGASIIENPVKAQSPLTKGTIEWGGAYGSSWWVDPTEKLTVIILTNTAFEGMSGKLPADIKNAIYSAK